MGRPTKPPQALAKPITITLKPDVLDVLEGIMAEGQTDNRSAAITKLILDEGARQKRRKKR
jgi:metal-responsive CopG/Arc/MetJ family transcriptional regulator